MIVAAALAAAGLAEPNVMHVGVQANGRCQIRIGNQAFDPEREAEAVERAIASLPDKAAVRLQGDEQVPFRCVGFVIYTMQRHGVGPIGYVSEPSREK